MTLGPSSETDSVLTRLARTAGRFRLNASHLSPEDCTRWLDRLDALAASTGLAHPVAVDLQGAKMRLGRLPACEVGAGRLELVLAAESSSPGRLPVPHPELFWHVQPGERLTLNDGRVELLVETVHDERLSARVLQGGPLDSRKGINRAAHPIPVGRLSLSDEAMLKAIAGFPRLELAYSFALDGSEAALLRGAKATRLIAKVERVEALENAGRLAAAFDELWMGRGDLCEQCGFQRLGPLQESFESTLAALGKPALLGGQVLEHMTHFPSPTRSEVVHLHGLPGRGWAGIVLSDETAVGLYPIAVADFLDRMLALRGSMSVAW
ncbi:MAG: hypothetical protein HY814_02330 [Candidatus Riflebacteria bacterium]|nr:hypothetical protein [Candidatus Riflebacteria bacterium]